MRPKDRQEAERLERQLGAYEANIGPLPGISNGPARQSFIEQLLESERRSRYVQLLLGRDVAPQRADPLSPSFDPLKAAILYARRGEPEEAFWLVFLFVHFGKHRRGGWRYVQDVYGRLGQEGLWDWESVSADVGGFRAWLGDHAPQIRSSASPGGFGNHRKYESLQGWTANGTGAVVSSYVQWIDKHGSHRALFEDAIRQSAGRDTQAFDVLYRSMSAVHRFGRTARFDYLCMVGRIGLAEIRPGKTYMAGATGPRRGAHLMLGSTVGSDASALEDRLAVLERYLEVGFDAMEDALCNWQKSPSVFIPFRG